MSLQEEFMDVDADVFVLMVYLTSIPAQNLPIRVTFGERLAKLLDV